jgi:hypothetical protein
MKVGGGWVLDICYTLVSLWNPHVRLPFGAIKPLAREYLSLLVDLYSFHANTLLSCKLVNWVEAREVSARENMIGVFMGSNSIKISRDRRNPQNRRWRKVAKIFPSVLGQPHLRLAIKDYVNALRDEGDDSMFFAYRAVENVCRSITGSTGQITPAQWTQMHATIGTDKDLIDPLLGAAKQVRHGNITSAQLVAARNRRDRLVAVSRDVIVRSFQQNAGWFIAPPKSKSI